MVISEMTISWKAAKVPKMPCRPGWEPKPAATEKLLRSMMPALTYTWGQRLRTWCRPQEPSRSESTTSTRRAGSSSSPIRSQTMRPNSSRFLANSGVLPRYSVLAPLAGGWRSRATAASWPRPAR